MESRNDTYEGQSESFKTDAVTSKLDIRSIFFNTFISSTSVSIPFKWALKKY